MSMRLRAIALVCAGLLLPATVLADDDADDDFEPPFGRFRPHEQVPPPAGVPTYPAIAGELEFRLGFDRQYKSQNRLNKLTDWYLDAEAFAGLFINRQISLQGKFVYERVKDTLENRQFGGAGLFMEQLFANYATDRFALFAGKFNAGFGTLHERLPEFFARGFVDDYKLAEAIGIGTSYAVEHPWVGEHEFGANLFFLDNSVLSNSLLTRPSFGAPTTDRVKRNRHIHGGPGNTKGPKSFSLTLDGGEIPYLPGFNYHLGYSYLHRGTDDSGTRQQDLKSYVVAAQWVIPLGKQFRFAPMIEHVWQRRAQLELELPEPEDDDDPTGPLFGRRNYLTFAAALEFKPRPDEDEAIRLWWARTHRTEHGSAEGIDRSRGDRLQTAFIEYESRWGVGLRAGWRRTYEPPIVGLSDDAVRTDSYGAQLFYNLGF